MKKIGILGSTGSIGTQTLDIVRKEKDLEVVSLAAGSNVSLLEAQIREFRPKIAALWEEKAAEELRTRVRDLPVRIVSGMEGLLEVSTVEEMEVLVTGIVGMIGIRPTIAAIEAGKDIALANKETLVTAGHIIMPLAKKKGVSILPVDSEHSAIFQSLHGENRARVEKILLTASGGPFRGKSREELADMTVEDALKHPNWSMGKKVTIDSASLCNKGLEVMEAKWLFDVALSQIEVVVHPQSILHSAVQYADGGIMGQMGVPDMKLPIQYALTYPKRIPGPSTPLDLWNCGPLTFGAPDLEAFPCLALALEAAKTGGTAGAILNGANEAAVGRFLEGKIGFLDIPARVEKALSQLPVVQNPTMRDILDADAAAREAVK